MRNKTEKQAPQSFSLWTEDRPLKHAEKENYQFTLLQHLPLKASGALFVGMVLFPRLGEEASAMTIAISCHKDHYGTRRR